MISIEALKDQLNFLERSWLQEILWMQLDNKVLAARVTGVFRNNTKELY